VVEHMKVFNNKLSSKDLASQRLKLILIHDRADLNPQFLEMIKDEIINIIAKYVVINNSDVEVKLITNDIEDNSSVLVANIPIKSYR
jgi:cell division topological specificity factor MinE